MTFYLGFIYSAHNIYLLTILYLNNYVAVLSNKAFVNLFLIALAELKKTSWSLKAEVATPNSWPWQVRHGRQ